VRDEKTYPLPPPFYFANEDVGAKRPVLIYFGQLPFLL